MKKVPGVPAVYGLELYERAKAVPVHPVYLVIAGKSSHDPEPSIVF